LNIDIFKEAEGFRGTSVIEILQNCVIYNNGAYDFLTDKEHREDRYIILKHGEPMIFGKNRDKGLILKGSKLVVAKIGENGISEKDILIHDAKEVDPSQHLALINMKYPAMPVAFGVVRAVETTTYNDAVHRQIDYIRETSKIKTMDELFNSGSTWSVE
jgi:2-oxoglutarate/2-oxoacid ferredoxin oxidoreductase subunit beta